VLWPKKLQTKLREPGPISAEAVASAQRHLASTLPPA
jgi:hypothetical protein